jgi:hypothetical protein
VEDSPFYHVAGWVYNPGTGEKKIYISTVAPSPAWQDLGHLVARTIRFFLSESWLGT